MRKTIRRIFRILWRSIFVFAFLSVLLYGALNISVVQTFMVKMMTVYLHNKTGADIQVGRVSFKPITSLELEDVLVKDERQDTLLYSGLLTLNITDFNFQKGEVVFGELCFDNALFEIFRNVDQQNEASTNIGILIDRLGKISDNDSLRTSVSESDLDRWLVGLERVVIRNSRFRYIESKIEPKEYGVNWADIDCLNWNAELSEFSFGDTVAYTVERCSFLEKSGLLFKNVSGRVNMMDELVLIQNVNLAFKESNLNLNKIEFQWEANTEAWGNYCKSIYQIYDVKSNSYANFRDLAYFNGILRGIDNTLHCAGVVSGTIENLEGENLVLGIDENTVFKGNFRTYGLPDVSNTIFDIKIESGYFDPKEMASIYLPWFKSKIPVPEQLYAYNLIYGRDVDFYGTFSDFSMQATSVTNGLNGNVNLYMAPDNERGDVSNFWGDFEMNSVQVSKLTNISDFGDASVYGKFTGARDSLNIYTRLETSWPFISVGKDKIRNLDLYLMMGTDVTHIYADVDNENIKFDALLSLETNYKSNKADFNFLSGKVSLSVDSLNNWGYTLADSLESISCKATLLSAMDDKMGYNRLRIDSLNYENSRGGFVIDSLLLERRVSDDRMELTLSSEPLGIYAEGKLNNLLDAKLLNDFLAVYIPAIEPKIKHKQHNRLKSKAFDDMDLQIYALAVDVSPYLNILYPDVFIERNSVFRLNFTDRDTLWMKVSSDSLRYLNVEAKNFELNLKGNTDSLKVVIDADMLSYDTLMTASNFRNRVDIAENEVKENIFWSNWGDKNYSGNISFDVGFANEQGVFNVDVQIKPSVLVVDDSIWRVQNSEVWYNSNFVKVSNFKLSKGNSLISLNGEVAKDVNQKIDMEIKNISVERLSYFVPKLRSSRMFGNLSGRCSMADYFGEKNFDLNLELEEWGIDSDSLGTLTLTSLWDAAVDKMIVQGENRYEKGTPFSLYGTYAPKTDSLDVEIQLQTVKINRLNDYFGEYITGSSGGISGEINCVGTLDDPQLFGTVYLDSVRMKINMLNTSFMINDKLVIRGRRVLFDNFEMVDATGHSAVASGYFDIKENEYDVNCQFNKFILLNTNAAFGEAFYGRLCVSGLTHLNNLNGTNNIALDWVTENNSVLYLPISANGVSGTDQLLTFVQPQQDVVVKEIDEEQFSTLNLDANIEVNDNLEVQVIFDPTVGDVLTCVGNGNIKLTLDKKGELGMTGEYRVDRGDYLFTLGGIWNKRFSLKKGGSIVWNGTPYNATIDVGAIYNLKASLYELYASISAVDEGERTERSRKVPIQCVMNLSDKLMNPVISMDIDFPTMDSQTKGYIRSIFSTEDEINKQVFSLLVLNKFTVPDYIAGNSIGEQAGTAGVTTLTEMVSSKLSRWLSRMSDAVDVGVSYRMGDAITSDELELAFSTQLFNDRMTISANSNMNVGDTKATADGSTNNNIAGDFDVDVKLNKQGTLHLKAYSHTDEKILYNSTETIQGIGISYQEQFDTFRELMRKYFSFFKRKR